MTVVQCHGTFDLLHPGHIDHLQQARALGDSLVVTITADRCVDKGPGRPVFNEALRKKSLEALSCVDAVEIWNQPDAASAIRCVKPAIYCKGKDYEGSTAANFLADLKACQEVGAQVRYVGDITFSSTKLLNQHFRTRPAICAAISPKDFQDAIEEFSKLSVLVIGETIRDRYTTVQVEGLTSKNRVVSTRKLSTVDYLGGAAAVLRHIQQFTEHAQFGPRSPAVIKERFIEGQTDGHELSKLFAVYSVPPMSRYTAGRRWTPAGIVSTDPIYKTPRQEVVVVVDYGHGFLDATFRDALQEESKLLVVNCQTNSHNYGFNLLSHRYHRADAFTLDEIELTLDAGTRDLNYSAALTERRHRLGARYAWLTRGPTETLGQLDETACVCPPLEVNPVDTVGAGDAFLSVAALAAASQLPIELATFIGQLAGAQAVKIIGNARPISKAKLLADGLALLNG